VANEDGSVGETGKGGCIGHQQDLQRIIEPSGLSEDIGESERRIETEKLREHGLPETGIDENDSVARLSEADSEIARHSRHALSSDRAGHHQCTHLFVGVKKAYFGTQLPENL